MFNKYFTRDEEKRERGVDIDAFLYAPLKGSEAAASAAKPVPAKTSGKPASAGKGKPSIKDYNSTKAYLEATGRELDDYFDCSPEGRYVESAIDYTRFVARTIMAGIYDHKKAENDNKNVKKNKITEEELTQALRAKSMLDELYEKRKRSAGRTREFLDAYIQKIEFHGGRIADVYNKARKRQDRLKSQQIARLETVKKAVLDVGALRIGGAAGLYEIWPDGFQDVDLHVGSIHIHPKDWALMASALWIVGTTVVADRWRQRREDRIARQEEAIWNEAGESVTKIYEQVTEQTADRWLRIFRYPTVEHMQGSHGFIPLRPEKDGNGSYA